MSYLLLAACVLSSFAPGEEYAGPRSMAMGYASRGIPLSNEAIFLNPAGMAILPRYSIDINYLHRFQDNVAYPSFSIVDSRTTKLAAGFAYAYEKQTNGKLANHHAYLSLAYPLGSMAALGITTKYLRSGETLSLSDFHALTGDVGLIIKPGDHFSIGIVGYNLIDVGHDDVLPILVGGGLAYSGSQFILSADVVANVSDKDNPQMRYHAGAEYFIDNQFPIRIGYQKDEDTDTHRWSLGLGYINQSGSIDIGYRQDAHNPPDREITLALRFFM